MTVETEPKPGPLIYLIAGEPSGDLLGGRLMAALKRQSDGNIRFAGVGGTMMTAEGLDSTFPMTDLTVMGLAEVIPHIPKILRRVRETVEQIERLRPAVVVTIDSPDFTLRVSKKLKGKGIPLVHYVAPTVWAWKSGRAQKTAEFLDHMMALLPFEPQFFDKVGLDCTFVGHPVVDSGAKNGDGPAFRKEHGVPPNATLLCALPGSRAAEVRRLIPVFREVFDLLARDIPNLYIVMPIADGVAEEIRQATARWPAGIIFVQGEVARHDAFAASNLALAASGTVSLELAVAEVPTVITYKLNLISTYLARILVKVRFVNLINLLLDKEAIPELILEKCVPSRIAASVWTLYDDAEACSEQIANAREAIAKLTVANTSPSERAAQVVLAHVTVPSFAGWRAP